MGEFVQLVNYTRRQRIGGGHLPFDKPSEWAEHPAARALVTWYLLEHRTDEVRFVGDYQDCHEAERVVREFDDATDDIVNQLVQAGVLMIAGKSWQDGEDPDLYVLDLRLPDPPKR
ncbi:MAG: hypothetical protein RIB60_04930 [Phycisphaerales bacterium]